jgi:hypothetical protein
LVDCSCPPVFFCLLLCFYLPVFFCLLFCFYLPVFFYLLFCFYLPVFFYLLVCFYLPVFFCLLVCFYLPVFFCPILAPAFCVFCFLFSSYNFIYLTYLLFFFQFFACVLPYYCISLILFYMCRFHCRLLFFSAFCTLIDWANVEVFGVGTLYQPPDFEMITALSQNTTVATAVAVANVDPR